MNPPPDGTRRPGVLVELVVLLLWFLLFTRLDAAVGKDLAAADAKWSAVRGGHPRLALLSCSFPLIMAAVVLGTGNHYVLDIAGSIALLTAAVLAARVAGARRDECAPIPVVR